MVEGKPSVLFTGAQPAKGLSYTLATDRVVEASTSGGTFAKKFRVVSAAVQCIASIAIYLGWHLLFLLPFQPW